MSISKRHPGHTALLEDAGRLVGKQHGHALPEPEVDVLHWILDNLICTL